MNGLHGELLDVNLTESRIGTFTIPEEWQRRHLGGRGVGVRVLLEEQSSVSRPRDQTNLLVFMTGPLTGTSVPGASRYWVGSRSRLNDGLGEAYAGGSFGHELARTGYDGIVIRGRAEPFTAIVIDDKTARIVDATDCWGMTVAECEDLLAPEGGSFACIGPGGENFAGVATIVNDRNRVAAGGGLGTVMGRKRLKAIVVNGSSPPPIADADAYRKYRQEFEASLRANDQLMTRGNAPRSLGSRRNEHGVTSSSNDRWFHEGGAKEDEDLDTRVDMTLTREGCVNCPVMCKRILTGSINGESVEAGGPNFGSIRLLEELLSNRDLVSVALAHHHCNQYGLDVIAVGQAIATAAECVPTIDANDRETLLTLIENIAYMERAGEALGDGAPEAKRYFETYVETASTSSDSSQITRDDPEASERATGISPHDGRRLCLANELLEEDMQADWDFPIRRSQNSAAPGESAEVTVTLENARSFINSLVMCPRVAIPVGDHRNYRHIRNLVTAVTGRSMSMEDTLRIGERNFMLAVLFDLRERPATEALEYGFGPRTTDHSAISTARNQEEYRNRRGLTVDGVDRAKLRELGLLEIAEKCQV